MIDEQRNYLSYLLRLWQGSATLPMVWRASLENPQTGERLGFANIMQLFAYLEEQMAGGAVPGMQRMPRPPFGGPANHAKAGDVPVDCEGGEDTEGKVSSETR